MLFDLFEKMVIPVLTEYIPVLLSGCDMWDYKYIDTLGNGLLFPEWFLNLAEYVED